MPGQFRYIGLVNIEIHDEVLFLPSGPIRNWARKVAAAQTRNTKAEAPVNKRTNKFPGNLPVGSLRNMISSSVQTEGPKIVGVTTTSAAPYSIYVIRGTNPQYFRDAGGRFAKGGFPLPANNFGGFRRVSRIDGQRANNFMTRGLAKTGRAHPSLRQAGSKMMTFR